MYTPIIATKANTLIFNVKLFTKFTVAITILSNFHLQQCELPGISDFMSQKENTIVKIN